MDFEWDSEKASKDSTYNWEELDALSDEQIDKNALSDPDNLPLSKSEINQLKPVANIKEIRKKLGMTQKDFSITYHLPLRTIQEWEQGKGVPNTASQLLLIAIKNAPTHVRNAIRKG